MSIVSYEQVKMARAALGWSVQKLSSVSAVSPRTLNRIETEDGFEVATKGNLKLIQDAFEANGIEFFGDAESGPGVRIRRK